MNSASPTCLEDIDKIAEDLLAEIERELGDTLNLSNDESDNASDAGSSHDSPPNSIDRHPTIKSISIPSPQNHDERTPLRRNILKELDKVSAYGPPISEPPWMTGDRDLLGELEKLDKTGAAHIPVAAYPARSESEWPTSSTDEPCEKRNILEELDRMTVQAYQAEAEWFREQQEKKACRQEEPEEETSYRQEGIRVDAYVASGQGTIRGSYRVEQPPDTFHSINGAVFILFVAIELGQYLWTREASTVLRMINLSLAMSLYASGVFSRGMVHNPLGLLMNRLAAWSVAYIALGLSFFTVPGIQWSEGDLQLSNIVGTFLYPVAVLDSLSVLRCEVMNKRIYLQGFVVENTIVYTHLLGLPILRIVLGFDSVAKLYAKYPVAECVYVVSLCSALTVAAVSYQVCRVSSGKLEAYKYRSVSNLLWGWVHMPGCALVVGILNDFLVGTRFYARLLLIFFIGKILTKILESSQWLQYKSIEEARQLKQR